MKLLLSPFLLIPLCLFALLYICILLYVCVNVFVNSAKKADAILVLGAKSYYQGKYNPCLVSRVEHGVDLFKQGYASKIILSGGNDQEDGANEAQTMKEIAVKQGVASTNLLLESKSTSTYENLLYSQAIMKKNNIKSIIIVSEPFHSARIQLVAHSLHISYSLSPTYTSPCWTRWKFLSRYVWREPISILYYFVRGRI